MKSLHLLLWTLAVLTFSAVSSLSAEQADRSESDAKQLQAVTEKTDQTTTKTRTVEELAALVNQSVVVISYVGRDGRRAGVGAGFVVSSDGLIATNLHVIGEAREIFVQTADGKTHKVISIHATDRPMDLAVIRIDTKTLPALELGDSDSLKQGQDIVAIGNPQGLKYSIVRGIVSGRREIDGKPMIQLAIPIEPGNSGGPLLDMQGRVHGILTLKSIVTRNLGFAVGVNALKPLLEKPNPVPMSRWLTIGTLDPKQWEPLFGAKWRQRAGRILVEGTGSGFGGRSLCLSHQKVPEFPIEIGVSVRMKQEDGAAGLVFHADGKNKHYGFYPSSGKLRLSRFDGPDVFSWNVLREISSPHYRPGEWNYLKVRLEKNRIQCFLNDELVIESTDSIFNSGRIGIAKFRHTQAEFKGFRIAHSLESLKPSKETVKNITDLVADLSTKRPPEPKLVEALVPHAHATEKVLFDRARHLEEQAKRLRELAKAVHQKRIINNLSELLKQEEDKIDLLQAALLIAKLDNSELDVDAYLGEADRLAGEIKSGFPKNAGDDGKLKALDTYLFEQLGFHGSRTNYYSSSNSYLNEVIDDREGLPITISVLYMELARRVGLKVVGVGLPGHFVVRFEPKEGDGRLIDVFDRGKRLSRDDASQLVSNITGLALTDEHLVSQSKKAIIVRILHNLRGIAQEKGNAGRMLRYVETIVALEPDSGPDRWFRAVLRFQTDRYREAMKDIEWILDRKPSEVDLLRVRQLQIILERKLQKLNIER